MAEQSKSKKVDKADKGPAAVEEVKEKPKPRKIKIRGTEFVLPDQQPAELLFAAKAASRAARTKNEQGAVESMLDMAVAYVGEEPLRDLMTGLSVDEGIAVIQELLDEASEQYGTDQGESSASPKS